jgi:hypothetical protein
MAGRQHHQYRLHQQERSPHNHCPIDLGTLKVGDLRAELRRRALDSTGVKFALQSRLLPAVDSEQGGAQQTFPISER